MYLRAELGCTTFCCGFLGYSTMLTLVPKLAASALSSATLSVAHAAWERGMTRQVSACCPSWESALTILLRDTGLPPIPRVLHAQAWRDWTPFHRVSSLLCFLFIFCLWFYLYFSSKSMYFHKFQAFVYFFTNITFYGFSDFWGLFYFFSTFCCDVLLLFWFS